MDHTSTRRNANGQTIQTQCSNNDSSDSSCRGGFCHAVMACPSKVINMIWYNGDEHDSLSALNSSSDPIATAAAGFTLPRGEETIQSSDIKPSTTTVATTTANKQVPPSPTPFKRFYRQRKNAVSPNIPKQSTSYKRHEWRDDNNAYDHQNGDDTGQRFVIGDSVDPDFEQYQDNPTVLLDMGPPVDEDGNVLHEISI